jgi:ubiquitin-protein ligase
VTIEDPRTRRLRAEYEQMVELSARSDLISFEHFLVAPGLPPERYIVTFTCRGIAAIDDRYQPVYATLHKVALYLDSSYPTTPPRMKWLTPIWHPNIEHQEPHRVCIDNTWWTPGRSLGKIVLMLGEMVQYKNYHAEQTPPFPIDLEVARWVLWARKHRVLPRLPIDARELQRAERVKLDDDETKNLSSDVIIQVKRKKVPKPPPAKSPPRIRIIE